jgi:hypothetical protein
MERVPSLRSSEAVLPEELEPLPLLPLVELLLAS